MAPPGKRKIIGVSGGKDSLLLSLALATLRRRSPAEFDLTAVTIDQSDGSMDMDGTSDYMNALGIPLKIINHPTYKIIESRNERSPCSLCANMRRGILASEAKSAGCVVIALGHHKDDAVETVLLNMFYGGRIKCYHPNLYMSRTEVRVIRPFIYIEERSIFAEAARLGLPVTGSPCPYGGNSKRRSTKELLNRLKEEAPEIKSNVIHSLKNFSENDVWTQKGQKSADN